MNLVKIRSTTILAALFQLVVGCSDVGDKIERLKKAGDVTGLNELYSGFQRERQTKDSARVLDAVGTMTGDAADGFLVSVANGEDLEFGDRALAFLVKRRSAAAVAILIPRLLNTIQTGGDGKEIAGQIESIKPGAIAGARDGYLEKYREARRKGSTFSAGEYLEAAKVLGKIVGDGDLSTETGQLDNMKAGRRRAELFRELVASMEAGQLSRSHQVAKVLAPLYSGWDSGDVLKRLKTLSDLEDNFYAVAKRMDDTRYAYDKLKSEGVKGAKLQSALGEYQSAKSDMIYARRALEKGRPGLTVVMEKVKKAMESDKPE